MAGPTPPVLDPVGVVALLLTAAFGAGLPPAAAPYACIMIGASVGASMALTRRDPGRRKGAMLFMLRINVMALCVTWLLAEVAHLWIPEFETLWFIAPIAFVVGLIGDDWHGVGKWLISRLGRFIDRWVGQSRGEKS